MSDPLALVTLAVAAAGGRCAGQETGALVAAGHTLLRRSAILVRALASGRSAVGLPLGGAWLTALAASDGRGALLLDPAASGGAVARQLAAHGVQALFTTERLAERWGAALPADLVQVWLDRAPAECLVIDPGGARRVDLGSHFGLDLVGDTTTEGLDEPFVWVDDAWQSHRTVLAAARSHAATQRLTPVSGMPAAPHWTLSGLVSQLGLLLHGGNVISVGQPR